MASQNGMVLSFRQADTFLIHLDNPDLINAVPVIYHVKAGSTINAGHQLTDSTWADTVDLTANKARQVKVTGHDGNSKTWGVAWEYQVTVETPMNPYSFVRCIYFAGDTLYVGTDDGLYRSFDLGVTYTKMSGLGTVSVWSVVTSGNSIYVASNSGVFVSVDGGNSFSAHVLPFPTDGIYKQGGTLYVAGGNVYVSYDNGSSYIPNENGLGNLPIPIAVWCVYAQGDTVYAGTFEGLAVSYDVGNSFTIHSSGLGAGVEGDAQVNNMAVVNDSIFVASESGLGISTDGGLTFTEATTANGLGGNTLNVVAVGDGMVAAGTFYGLGLSHDGGKSFVNFTTKSGLAGNFIMSIAIHNGTIYAGTYSGFSNAIVTMKPRI